MIPGMVARDGGQLSLHVASLATMATMATMVGHHGGVGHHVSIRKKKLSLSLSWWPRHGPCWKKTPFDGGQAFDLDALTGTLIVKGKSKACALDTHTLVENEVHSRGVVVRSAAWT
jgi:hypothetical protein